MCVLVKLLHGVASGRSNTLHANSIPLLSGIRSDEKTAKELGVKAGDVLHLVLALRGGCW